MGGSIWSTDSYSTRVADKVVTRGTAFVHDHDIKTGISAPKAHTTLDPKGLKMRESRDSAAHPESNAIMVGLDITGSMGSVVHAIHKKLPTMMGILTRKAYIADPQILFGAIGDASSHPIEVAPLQVGQFESGDEMEGDISNFHIEGKGGGQNTESYELFAYVGARHTSIDCFDKRSKKGYCFIIGDELPYTKVFKDQVDRLIGTELEADIPTGAIFKELQEKYVTFFILPTKASNGRNPVIINHWKELLGGEHVLILDDPEGVSELIATQIGLCEGTTDIDSAAKDLTDHGTSTALVSAVRSSVSKGYNGGELARVSPGTLTPSGTPGSVKRL